MRGTNEYNLAIRLNQLRNYVIRNYMYNVFYQTGKQLIEDAIAHSTELAGEGSNSLTGNVKYGYAVGFYVGKHFRAGLTATSSSVSGNGTPSIGMVVPGFYPKGFADIDTGEIVKSVRNYSSLNDFVWQPTEYGQQAYKIAWNYLTSEYKPKQDLELLMVNGAPYGEYIQDRRGLDVMTTASMEASEVLQQNMKRGMNLDNVNWSKFNKL